MKSDKKLIKDSNNTAAKITFKFISVFLRQVTNNVISIVHITIAKNDLNSEKYLAPEKPNLKPVKTKEVPMTKNNKTTTI